MVNLLTQRAPLVAAKSNMFCYMRSLLGSSLTAYPVAKPKTIFLHIPKTAGTSLMHLFAGQYPRGRCLFIYSHQPEVLASSRRLVENVEAIFGHFSYGIHELLDVEAQYVTFLRNPIDRVISYFNHQARDRHSEFYDDILRGLTLLDLLESRRCHQVQNHMCQIISGYGAASPLHKRSLLDAARHNLATDFAYVGITEFSGRSALELSHNLGFRRAQQLQQFGVAQAPQLKTATVDVKTLQAINDCNALDIELHAEHTRRIISNA